MNLTRAIIIPVIALLLSTFSQSAIGQTTAKWINPEGGNWFDGDNWDTGEVPSNSEGNPIDVVIDLETESPYEVVAGGRNNTIQNLTIDSENAVATWRFSGLEIENLLDLVAGKLVLLNSTVKAKEIRSNGNQIKIDNVVTFDGALVRGDLFAQQNWINLTNGANINGRIELRQNSVLGVDNFIDQAPARLEDTFILLDNSRVISRKSGQTILGPNSSIAGYGSVGTVGLSTFFNEGNVFANVADQTLILDTGNNRLSSESSGTQGHWINRGTIRASNGGVLQLGEQTITIRKDVFEPLFVNDESGKVIVDKDSSALFAKPWTSRGVIEVRSGGQLTINSPFKTTDIQSIVPRRNSKVLIQRTLWDNHDSAINLNLRADQFSFDSTIIDGGIIHAKNNPLRFGGSNSLKNSRFVGRMVLNNASMSLDNSRLVGSVQLNGRSSFSSRDSDVSAVDRVEMGDPKSRLSFSSSDENQPARFNASQEIIGQGTIIGLRLRNFATITADASEGTLSVVGARRSSDFISNRGQMQAANGGILSLNSLGGLLYNHAEGVIRAGENSTVRVESDRFVNHGSIELLANSVLQLQGRYRTELLDSITTVADTASISLEGRLDLKEDEVFKPTREFTLNNDSSIHRGSIDFSDANAIGTTAGEVVDAAIIGDAAVQQDSTLNIRGSLATIAGDFEIDGGTLDISNDAKLDADLHISESGLVRIAGEVSGDVVIDGPESKLIANSSFSSGDTTITLRNSALFETGDDVTYVLPEESRLVGNGTVNVGRTFGSFHSGQFENQGLIAATDSDAHLIFNSTSSFLRPRLHNKGTILVRDGGQVTVVSGITQSESDARIVLDNGTLIASSAFIGDGVITGNGTIESKKHYYYGGKISPGVTVGRLDFIGDVLPGPNGSFDEVRGEVELLFDIAGTRQGEVDGYDLLSIDGDLDLGIGELFSLRVNSSPDITIADLSNNEFSIIELSGDHELVGTFQNVVNGGFLTTLDNRFGFQVFYGAESSFGSNQVVLTNFSVASAGFSLSAVPEPNALLLIAFTSTVFATRRKRI